MSQSRFTYDQASMLLLGWYHSMRVEHLTEEEINCELKARTVIVTHDMGLARKRKCLRDRLRAEGEGKCEKPISTGDPTNELKRCAQICTELNRLLETEKDEENKRGLRTRLIHYGARVVALLTGSRGSPNSHGYMQNMLVEIVHNLEQYYGRNVEDFSIRDSSQNDTLVREQPAEESLMIQPISPNAEENEEEHQGLLRSRDNQDGSQSSRLNQEELEWIHSLQVRIASLEDELAIRKDVKDAATQTLPYIAQNPLPSSNPNPDPHNFEFPTFAYQSNNPFTSSSIHNSQNKLSEQFSTSQGFLPHPANFNNLPFEQQQAPDHNRFPVEHLSIPVHNQNFSKNPIPNSYPFIQIPHPYQPRHTLPVSKWNIAKYGGDDQGMKLNEFLEIVQALALAEHVSERELFESAVHLFTGSALKWYMSQRSTGRLINWQHLVFELRRTYMHPDLDALIKMRIYQRRQQKHESFHEFYFEMEKLFRTMSVQIPDYEKIQILQQNMRVDYKRQMTFLPITDLETLVAAGQKLDALNFSAYSKVFGTERSVQAVGNQETNNRGKQRDSQSPPPWQKRSSGPPKQSGPPQNQNRNNRNPTTHFSNTRPHPASSSQNKPSSQSSRTVAQKEPIPGPSGLSPRPQLTLEQLVNEHKPPATNSCFNCGTAGHHFVMCRQPRRLFCDNCGLHGFPANFCPFCLKNGPRANENRRSQNSEA